MKHGAGGGPGPGASSPTIGLVVAMRMEARPLLKLAPGHDAEEIGTPGSMGSHARAWRFQSLSHRCVMVLSGMGRAPARKATRALIDAVRPAVVVSFGIAGAVGKGLGIGDILLARRCLTWQDGKLGAPLELAALSSAIQDAACAAAAARGVRCVSGTVITVKGIQPVPVAVDGPAVVEMETVGVAEAAAERGIQVVSIRAVSDSPHEPIPFVMGGGEEFHVSPLCLLRAMMRNPRIIRPLFRLKRNSQAAARNLAEVVKAVVDLPGFSL